jgi:hypothetical protein
MQTDRHVEAHIEEKVLPQQHICRLANGSIDYTFYDRRAREGRGVAVRAGFCSLAGLLQYLAGLMFDGRAARQRKTEQTQVQPSLFLVHQQRENATASQKTHSEAA